MKTDAFAVVRQFEAALCEYTGAPYAVTTTSCTMALLLAVAWHLRNHPKVIRSYVGGPDPDHHPEAFAKRTDYTLMPVQPAKIEIPKRTYISVPMSIIHAGGRPTFRDEFWRGAYQLKPLQVWDSARWLTGGHYRMVCERLAAATGQFVCLSFHWSKTLGIQQGGAILHDNREADAWLRRARFDGRAEGVAPEDDLFDMIGWHAYLAPEMAAEGLVRLSHLPEHNDPLPHGGYPDLSTMEIFK